MHFTRYIPVAVLIGTILLAPVPAPAANTEMQSLQRDVAQLQDQVGALQKALLDPQTGTITALQTMVQQALDTANKTNSNVNNLNNGLMTTMQTAMKGLSDQLTTVTGLSATVTSISSDVSNLGNTVQELQRTVNKQGLLLNDILNQMKLLQAPPAAPPDAASAGPGATPPPPSQQTLFSKAASDQNAGQYDLALTEYKEFLRVYPDDANAIRAQYNVGNIYYSMSKPAEAVKALDAALEQYPVDQQTTPSIYFMKGMALKQLKDKPGAIASFRKVLTFPHAAEAEQAKTQLTTLNAATPPKKPTH